MNVKSALYDYHGEYPTGLVLAFVHYILFRLILLTPKMGSELIDDGDDFCDGKDGCGGGDVSFCNFNFRIILFFPRKSST